MGQYFEGLSIWKEEHFREIQGTYPVISLSFADIKATTYASARMSIIRKLVRLYSSFEFIRSSEALNEKDRAYFDSVGENMSDDAAAVAVNYMSDYLSRYYGKKVIILLDEYDTPLQEACVYGYWEELTAFIRSLFNSTFKTSHFSTLFKMPFFRSKKRIMIRNCLQEEYQSQKSGIMDLHFVERKS